MALNTRIQAACLLLLLLASLTSASVLLHQVGRAPRAWAQRAARTGESGPERGLLRAAGDPQDWAGRKAGKEGMDGCLKYRNRDK